MNLTNQVKLYKIAKNKSLYNTLKKKYAFNIISNQNTELDNETYNAISLHSLLYSTIPEVFLSHKNLTLYPQTVLKLNKEQFYEYCPELENVGIPENATYDTKLESLLCHIRFSNLKVPLNNKDLNCDWGFKQAINSELFWSYYRTHKLHYSVLSIIDYNTAKYILNHLKEFNLSDKEILTLVYKKFFALNTQVLEEILNLYPHITKRILRLLSVNFIFNIIPLSKFANKHNHEIYLTKLKYHPYINESTITDLIKYIQANNIKIHTSHSFLERITPSNDTLDFIAQQKFKLPSATNLTSRIAIFASNFKELFEKECCQIENAWTPRLIASNIAYLSEINIKLLNYSICNENAKIVAQIMSNDIYPINWPTPELAYMFKGKVNSNSMDRITNHSNFIDCLISRKLPQHVQFIYEHKLFPDTYKDYFKQLELYKLI